MTNPINIAKATYCHELCLLVSIYCRYINILEKGDNCMKVNLTKEDLELIGKALISHRWKVEDTEGQNDEFHRCTSLADRLACV